MERNVNGVHISLRKGDIAAQDDVVAVVNAANAELKPGGGVAGALHRAAGPGLYEACKDKAPLEPGEAVITEGFNLQNAYVIHCLGPVYGVDTPEAEKLRSCYIRALQLAEEHHVESIAFPALSAGAFEYPLDEAAKIALSTVMKKTPTLSHIKRIRFVLFDDATFTAFKKAFEPMIEKQS